jgi:flavin reductase (DIM6/NTAB) family NADH-FMN oxidoreductase RutF
VAKVAFDPHKQNWHPSVLPGQIVLVTTVDERGEPNVAPKSWVTMAAFDGPVVAFGCTEEHLTLRNVEDTGEFVVNVPSEHMADLIWQLVRHHGEDRIRTSGLTMYPAQEVRPPVVEECRAHLECRLERVERFGAEAFVFGQSSRPRSTWSVSKARPRSSTSGCGPCSFSKGGRTARSTQPSTSAATGRPSSRSS